jgi:hypothetical protein
MRSAYTSPDMVAGRKRALGKKLMPIGAVAMGAGVVGVVLANVLKAVWLGLLGGPIGALSWLALIGGAAAFWYGYAQVQSARRGSD